MLYFSEGMFEFCDLAKGAWVRFHQEEIALNVHAEKVTVYIERRTPADLTCAPFLIKL